MLIDARARICPKHFDERAIVSRGARCVCIERRKLLENFGFLVGSEVTAADLVDVLRAAGVHHERAVVTQRVPDREVNRIRSAGNLAYGAHGSVDHHDVASR